MLNELLTLLFPEYCINCKKAGSSLCAICERTITIKARALSGTTVTLFDYRQPLVKKAIWALKYHRKRSLGKYFGNALYREFFKQLSIKNRGVQEDIVLIPIPASAKAIAVRGYNHASVIAKEIAKCAKKDGLRLSVRDDILLKKHENEHQVGAKGKSHRIKNVENIYTVAHGKDIEGKTIILIDDVITTGATISEAQRVLREMRPKRIFAIAAAH